jgi:hypothetical protein
LGQIVGFSTDGLGVEHPTLFDPTGHGNNIDIDLLGGGRAYSINNRGQIVGVTAGGATLFDPTGNGNNINLNTLIAPNSGWTLDNALSINDRGWIVGWCRNTDGELHGYLLVPEPATIGLLGLGMLCFRRRTKQPGGKGNA